MVSVLLYLHIPTSDLIVCGILKYTWVDSLCERKGDAITFIATDMVHIIHTFQKGSRMSLVLPPLQLVSVLNWLRPTHYLTAALLCHWMLLFLEYQHS